MLSGEIKAETMRAANPYFPTRTGRTCLAFGRSGFSGVGFRVLGFGLRLVIRRDPPIDDREYGDCEIRPAA